MFWNPKDMRCLCSNRIRYWFDGYKCKHSVEWIPQIAQAVRMAMLAASVFASLANLIRDDHE